MEDIKTNFDKIMEQFAESTIQYHSIPKRLSFENASESFESIRKKRKLSIENTADVSINTPNVSIDHNSTPNSLNASLTSSPWESRRMRADLIEAKSRIVKLKKEIEHQHTVRSNLEIMFNNKTSALQQQCDFTANKVADLEKHVTLLRKREAAAKHELVKAKNTVNQQKQAYEDTVYSLQRANKELEEKYRATYNKLSNEIGEYDRQVERLQLKLDERNDDFESLAAQLNEHKMKADSYDRLKSLFEDEQQCHELSKSKIKELEYEVASYGEWKELSKSSQSRLCSMPDLEKELTRVKQENKNLRDSIGNKLLLEEQVYDLKTRLEKYDEISSDTVSLRVQINTLEQELIEWKQLAADHCPANYPKNALSLRNRIEQLLQKDVVMASEKGNNRNEKDCIQSQLEELKTQNEIYVKANSDLQIALKHHKNIMLKVQKKLILVAKQRDCYRQLVENFEKDLTITGALADALNPENQLRARLEMLEKTLTGYKDMCSNLEKEMTKLLPDIPLEMPVNTESYDRLKKEIEVLRVENERLRRRKEELELELEHRYLKGDIDADKYKIVHMTMNPAAEAYENSKNEIEKLQAEIERLKRKNRKLEENQEEMTTRFNETQNLTVNVKEMNTLRAKLESAESKMQHMKDLYKTVSLELREVCYMLFGYRIDRVGNTNYRISSMYSESEDDYLNFRLNESGVLDMLETEYSISLGEMMRTHLAAHNSLPAFLSALTLELFNRTTIMV